MSILFGRKPRRWPNPPEVIIHVYGRGWIFKRTPEGDIYERAWLWRTLAEGICAASGRRTCMTAKYPLRDRFVYEPGRRLF